jgi:hypothetical protein
MDLIFDSGTFGSNLKTYFLHIGTWGGGRLKGEPVDQ